MPPKKKAGSAVKKIKETPVKAKRAKAITKPKVAKAPAAPKKVKVPAAPKRAKAGHVAENVHEKIAVVPEQKPPLHRSKIQSRPRPPLNGSKSLPRRGETQMVAFIRDPQCIFTYWEITPEGIEDVKRQLTDEFHHSSMVLMVFKIGANGHPELVQEIKVEPGDMNRYIDLNDPRGTYYLEVAQKTPSGRTVVYVRSNKITLGPSEFGGSDVSARQWETPAGILEYFSKEEFTENYYSPGGPSSMDSLKRKKGHYSSSDFR